MLNIKTIDWKNNELILIDCRKLPLEESYIHCKDYRVLCQSIKKLSVRGAPAIGIAAAYGVVLAAIEGEERIHDKQEYIEFINTAIKELSKTRPTAVNLFWALNRMKNILDKSSLLDIKTIRENLSNEAHIIFREDIENNIKMGKYGNNIVPQEAGILTHCNAGALATGGYGTALGVIRSAHESRKNIHVYIDETRPLLQGSRLTAWEMLKEGIPSTLITDSMAGYVMKLGKIDMVIFGADRIASNGDTANKIGSYSISILAKEHDIPVYVAAPLSTIDENLSTGNDIPIEERSRDEVKTLYGTQIAPSKIDVFNPAFDVTPNKYIKGIITEVGILNPPFKGSIKEALKNKKIK